MNKTTYPFFKKLIFALMFLALVLTVLWAAEAVVRISTGNLYYIPDYQFWKLDRYTNLFGQYDHEKEFQLSNKYEPKAIAIAKPEKVIRIITMGGSATEGFGVGKEKTYSYLLQRKLDEGFGEGRFEVLNGGVTGYVSYQLLVYFKEVLLKLSPDIVVLYLGYNDSNYFEKFSARTYYEKVREAASRIGNDKVKREQLLKYGLHGTNPVYRFLAESRLFGFLYLKSYYWTEQRRWKAPGAVFLCPPEDRQYVLEEFIKLSQEYGFTLIFVPEVLIRKSELGCEGYYQLMKKMSAGHAVFLDLKPVFRKYPDDEIFIDIVHPTPLGHRLMSEALYEAVSRIYKK